MLGGFLSSEHAIANEASPSAVNDDEDLSHEFGLILLH